MNDKIFGEVEYKDGAWKRDETIEVYGKSRDITIEIRADRQDASLEVQKKAYQSFLSHREQYLQQMPKVFLAEYLYNYEDIQSRVMFSENSPLLKENINEVVIMQTVAPLVLYFDTTGDYGWICKCGWTRDRAQAILLSGKEPRILAPDQLRNLHKRNDDTFGLLVHDCKNAWRGLTKHSFFGEEENLVIELEGSVEDGITEEQNKAYSEYLEKEDELFKRFMEVLQASEKKGTALPKTLYIDIEGNYGWICYAQWNKRYIGVLLSEETPRILKTNQLLKYRKRNSPVVLEDFKNEETHSYGIGYVWGNEIDIDVYRKDHSLEEMLPLINKLVEFLNHHKDAFVKALLMTECSHLQRNGFHALRKKPRTVQKNAEAIWSMTKQRYIFQSARRISQRRLNLIPLTFPTMRKRKIYLHTFSSIAPRIILQTIVLRYTWTAREMWM